MSQPVDARPYDPRRGPWPTPLPPKTSTTGPMVMTIVGIVLTAVALVLVVAGIVRFSDTVSEDGLDLRHGRDSVVEVRTDIPDPARFTAEEDTTYAVLFFGDQHEDVDVDDLAVTGPAGQDIDLVESHMSYSSSSRITSYLATFETDDAGTYTLSVGGPSAEVDGELAVTDDELVVDLVLGAVSGILLLVAGALTGAIGLGLAVGGAVWWTVRRRAARPLTR